MLINLVDIALIPDGKLGNIYGNIKTQSGEIIDQVLITVESDTTITTGNSGIFHIGIPPLYQKTSYKLHFEKPGYASVDEIYYPRSGSIDIRMSGIRRY